MYRICALSVLVYSVFSENIVNWKTAKKSSSRSIDVAPKYIRIYTSEEDLKHILANSGSNRRTNSKFYDPIDDPYVLFTSVDNIHEQEAPVSNQATDYTNNHDNLQSDYGKFTTESAVTTETLMTFTSYSPDQNFVPNSQSQESGVNNKKNRVRYRRRRPKYKIHRPAKINKPYYNDEDLDESGSSVSYIQKIPKYGNKSKDTKERIDALLKECLLKLYQQKYNTINNSSYFSPDRSNNTKNIENLEPTEGKIFEEHLSALKNKTTKLINKLFSLFHVVKFNNMGCQVTGTSNEYEGICYTQEECDEMGGMVMGNCANGYGVCCVFRYSCGDSSNRNCSYFESPGYPDYYPSESSTAPPPPPTTAPPTLPPTVPTENPSPTPDPRKPYLYYAQHYKDQFNAHFNNQWLRQGGDNINSLSCSFSISRMSDDIKQMRIDFIDLELMGPTNGMCTNEMLIISGQNLNDQIPAMCGYNTGQHVYVDVSTLTGPLQLSVLSTMISRKRFKIRICQLASMCSNQVNCLQYYTGITGVVSSFNYDQAAMYNRSTPGYFNNLNYAICIRKEAGYCSITYTNVQNGMEYPFELVNLEENGQSTVPVGQAGVEIIECPDDYIVIDGIRLCGYKLNDGTVIDDFTMNAPVQDTSAGPIVIPVRTNQAVTGRGFKLFYTQNPCPIAG